MRLFSRLRDKVLGTSSITRPDGAVCLLSVPSTQAILRLSRIGVLEDFETRHGDLGPNPTASPLGDATEFSCEACELYRVAAVHWIDRRNHQIERLVTAGRCQWLCTTNSDIARRK